MNASVATLLGTLCNLAATLASLRNPAFAPVIAVTANGINAELAHLAAGHPPTAASVVENVAPGAVTVGATLAALNNPAHADAITASVQAIVTAIATPSVHKDAVAAVIVPPLPAVAPAVAQPGIG